MPSGQRRGTSGFSVPFKPVLKGSDVYSVETGDLCLRALMVQVGRNGPHASVSSCNSHDGILNNICGFSIVKCSNYKDLRIAVLDYRDYPVSPYGDSGDWITKVRTVFTKDVATARNAINAISSGGGNDMPEAVFSAVARTMAGSEIGAWRADAERRIILMGDAPGHDPEPWAGGYSYSDIIAYWSGLEDKVAVHSVYIGGSADATAQLTSLAADTGGSTRYAASASGVVGAMEDLITEFTETPRFPRDGVKSFMPVFSFVPPSEAMGPPIQSVLLELQIFDGKKGQWKNYKKVTLAPDSTTWVSPKPLPLADYRWRVGFNRKTGVFMLPSGESRTIRGATIMEEGWTEFSRKTVDPGTPVQLSPYKYHTAAQSSVTYQFTTVLNADSYAVEIWAQDKEGIWKVWKKMTLKPSKKDAGATILEKALNGHKAGITYRWRVQPLNYDRKKPIDGEWIGLP